jgi:hypothetical protein
MKRFRETEWGLERSAMYLIYSDAAAARTEHRRHVSIGIVVGPFRGDSPQERSNAVADWQRVIAAPYAQPGDEPWRHYLRYKDALRAHSIYYAQDMGPGTEKYAEVQCHLLTPDQALPIMSDMARIRELFATAPVATTPAPVTLWDMMTDDATCNINIADEDDDNES